MMTVRESTEKAQAMMKYYKYLYGAKGQPYTKSLVKQLAKQYPKKFTASLKKEALKDADKGFMAGDCSFFVCSVLGIPQINSLAIKQRALTLIKPSKSSAMEGMALWKNGHVAYIGDGLKIYEFKNTKEDTYCSSFDARAKDFTYMFVVKGSPLEYELNNQINEMMADLNAYYPKYNGKGTSIVSALETVGEKDTSFAHRKQIARVNGITNYEGSAKQNLKLVDLIKAGKLRRPK